MESGKVLAEIMHEGEEILLLRGGKGGWGNERFKTSIRQAPMFARPGDPGEEVCTCLRDGVWHCFPDGMSDGVVVGSVCPGVLWPIPNAHVASLDMMGQPLLPVGRDIPVARMDMDDGHPHPYVASLDMLVNPAPLMS